MCRLRQDSAEPHRNRVFLADSEEGDLTDRTFSLTAFTSSAAGAKFRVERGAWDDVGAKSTRLVALRIA